MNVFQRLHAEYLALSARVRTLETQVGALERDQDETLQTLGDLVRSRLEALDQRIHSLEKAQAPRTRPWDRKPKRGDEDGDGTGQTPPDAHDLAALREGWTQLCQAESSADRKPPTPGGQAEGDPLDPGPPSRTDQPASKPVGRPNTKARRVRQFLLDALDKEDHLVASVLCRECRQAIDVSEETFWRAAAELVAAGVITKEGGKGTGRATELHRVPQKAPAPQDPGVP
jgi:hypothetical protein